MSSSTGVTDDIGAALCQEQSVMLGVSWLFSVIWFIMFSVWVGVLVTSCRVRQVRCLQVVMLIVPFFHLGDAIWQLWTYTHCQCMQCHFTSYTAIWVWIGAQYTFSLGRLTALLLCLFLISTGAGTVRMSLLTRNWAELFVLFAGFVLSMALGLPLTVVMLGTDSMAAFIASIIFYGLILMTIFVEAYGNARVLKAQLVMIRAQGIAPRTTPAFAKFRMFTRLRRWVFGYFVMHTFIIIAQIVQMQLWERVTLLVVWELAQIAVTTIFSLAFSKSAAYSRATPGIGEGSESTLINPYLEREGLLAAEDVRSPMSADEVTLGWDDLGMMTSVQEDEDGTHERGSPLVPWRPDVAVPPPPAPMAMVQVFSTRRNRTRRGARRGAPVAMPTTSTHAVERTGVPDQPPPTLEMAPIGGRPVPPPGVSAPAQSTAKTPAESTAGDKTDDAASPRFDGLSDNSRIQV